MAPKQVLYKNAWEWAEQTNPNKVTLENIWTAYRVMLSPCPAIPSSCRKNCEGNPNCYNYLGEKTWIEKNPDEDLKDAVTETSTGLREPGTFLGLKNLGATCYANTFLQVWFHNPEFRRGILEWTNDKSGQTNAPEESFVAADDCLQPTTGLAHLQLIFALLLFSDRPHIDPSSFIECLRLDTSQQQDAQEFSKLFMALIEDQLPAMDCYHGLNLIQHQFVGHYQYVTRCSGCGQQTQSGSKFYEIDLNIKGHVTLDDCLKEFLQEEVLDGENQYFCQLCRKKQNVVRRIHLVDLPPTLNFQLLRFVFDRQTQNKKKLQSYIHFPLTLDMNEYMIKPGDLAKSTGADLTYDLVSVLIHRGPGAHSGHYVAVIKDCCSGATYRFNDEEVEKLSSDTFRLDAEEDADGGGKSSKKTNRDRAVPKGFLSSRNAYMLVYRKRNSGIVALAGNHSDSGDALISVDVKALETTLQDLSPNLQALVKQDNQKHEEALREQFETKRFYIDKDRERQDMVKNFYDVLQKTRDAVRDDDFEWVATSWLKDWLAADCMGTVDPIDNSSLLCPHDKMHPDNVGLAKAVPKAAADIIFEKFGGTLRLPCLASVCRQCVEEKCRIINTKSMLTEDHKTITALLKSKDSGQETDTSYWIGKRSLRRWRQMAEHALEPLASSFKDDTEQENEPENGAKDLPADDHSSKGNHVSFSASTEAVSGDGGDAAVMADGDTTAMLATVPGDEEPEEGEQEDWFFNEDLLCARHNDLHPDTSSRRLVTEEIWMILKKYFPKAPEFSYRFPVCNSCKNQDDELRFFKEKGKAAAIEQRQRLADLYQEKRRPSWSTMPDITELNIVSCDFLEDWRKFIREPTKQDAISNPDNISLLCNHGLFMYDLEHEEALHTKYEFIYPHEWSMLMNYMSSDVEIRVYRNPDKTSGRSFLISPEFCEKCCRERQQEEISLKFTYTKEGIYIRKVTDETRPLFTLTLNSSKSPTVMAPTSDGEGLADETDDVEVINGNGKRKHANGGSAEKVPRLEIPASPVPGVRRSARRGRLHDEVKITVSSAQTLRELKMQLVKAFSVMKLDQHLYFEGVELCDESATLEQLRIPPNSILYLQADEPSGETTFMDVSPVNSVEEGFKGTTLVGR